MADVQPMFRAKKPAVDLAAEDVTCQFRCDFAECCDSWCWKCSKLEECPATAWLRLSGRGTNMSKRHQEHAGHTYVVQLAETICFGACAPQDALSFQGALEVCERARHFVQAPALLEEVAQLSEAKLVISRPLACAEK